MTTEVEYTLNIIVQAKRLLVMIDTLIAYCVSLSGQELQLSLVRIVRSVVVLDKNQ